MATSGHVTVTFFAVLSGVSMCSSRSAAPRIQRSRFAPAGSYQVLDGFALDGCRRDLELEVRRMVCSQFRRSSSPGLAVLVDDARCLQRVLTVELVHVVPASLRPGWVIKRVTDVALRARPFAFVARRGWRGGGLCRPDQGLVAVQPVSPDGRPGGGVGGPSGCSGPAVRGSIQRTTLLKQGLAEAKPLIRLLFFWCPRPDSNW